MEFHQLRYFLSTAEVGSFTGAAVLCNVSQPSLSQQIKKLEDELGCELFERSPHGCKLNETGQLFAQSARTILQEEARVKRLFTNRSSGFTDSIRIGSIQTVGPQLIPNLCRAFQHRFPQVKVELIEEEAEVLLQRLKANQLDIVISDLIVDDPHWEQNRYMTEPYLVVVPINHPLAERSYVSLGELRDDTLILANEQATSPNLKNAIELHEKEGGKVNAIKQIETVYGMVSHGMGVSFIPNMAQRWDSGVKHLLLGESLEFCRSIYICGRTKNQHSKNVAEFLNLANKVSQESQYVPMEAAYC